MVSVGYRYRERVRYDTNKQKRWPKKLPGTSYSIRFQGLMQKVYGGFPSKPARGCCLVGDGGQKHVRYDIPGTSITTIFRYIESFETISDNTPGHTVGEYRKDRMRYEARSQPSTFTLSRVLERTSEVLPYSLIRQDRECTVRRVRIAHPLRS